MEKNPKETMAHLPSDIVPDLLPLLPAESLLRFRAVSRDWRTIINDKSFIDSHTIRSKLSSTTLLIRNPTSSRLYSIFVDSLINCADGDQENVEATSVPAFSCPGFSRMPDFPLPSCNGLILLHTRNTQKNWIIVNPFTQTFFLLRRLSERVCYSFAGLGYDSSSDDYKVVAIGIFAPKAAYSFIYSMKADRWSKTRIGNVYPNDIIPGRRDGIFVNGFLHWKSMLNYSVTRFDLATERFDEVLLPETGREVSFWDCGLLDGCLVVSLYYEEGRCLEGWVMKEGEWMKLFSVENSVGFMRPIAYLKRRKGLVLLSTWCNKKLFLLDIEKKLLRMVHIEGLPDEISSVMCFSGSLVRLEESYGVTTQRSRVRKRANARLKLSVKAMDIELID